MIVKIKESYPGEIEQKQDALLKALFPGTKSMNTLKVPVRKFREKAFQQLLKELSDKYKDHLSLMWAAIELYLGSEFGKAEIFTAEQLREILDIIRKYHNAFVWTNVNQEISPQMLRDLVSDGIVSGKPEDFKDYFKDAYEIERLRQIVKKAKFRSMDYEQFKRFLMQRPIPLTDTELSSIRHVRRTAGEYMTKQGDLLAGQLSEIAKQSGIALKTAILGQAVRTPLEEGIERRKSIGAIVSAMREASQDTFRDWHRVAQTEIQNARNHAALDGIYKTNPDKDEKDILVYKRPKSTACRVCKAVYLKGDGTTPKVFRLSEMKRHISNVGIKGSKKWNPTLESVHPWCQCDLFTLPDSYGFDEDGQIVFKGEKFTNIVKPEPAEKQWHLYDSEGNLVKSNLIKSLKKSQFYPFLKIRLEKSNQKTVSLGELVKILQEIAKHCAKCCS